MFSWMLDSRVVFLIWFIIIAIIIAIILIVIEFKTRKKIKDKVEKSKILTPVDKVHNFLKGKSEEKEKLNFVGKVAKDYFKDEYGIPLKLDYSGLAEEFKKRGKFVEVEFCEKMFKAYYSDDKISGKSVERLAGLFADIFRKKESDKKFSDIKKDNFLDKFENSLKEKFVFVYNTIMEYLSFRREKSERVDRSIARIEHETMKWVHMAIRQGYDKEKIKGLLNDGKRSKKEVKNILKIYDKEKSKISVSNISIGEGIASKIIKKEVARLDDMQVPKKGV